MSTTPGCAWRRSTTNSASPTAPRRCATRRPRCSSRFNEAFWDEESGFYAFMLDGEKRKVLTRRVEPGPSAVVGHRAAGARRARGRTADGAGHELGLGHPHAVGAASRVQSVFLSERLGLAARQQPDRARLQALWLRARGRRRSPATSRGAASHFLLNQLPELYAGVQRGDTDFPVQYLGANVPQAWAAGSVFALLQAILGIQPDAPRGRILRRSRVAGLAAGHHAVRPPARPAQHRHPLLARRRGDALRGAARSGRDCGAATLSHGCCADLKALAEAGSKQCQSGTVR